MKDLLSIIKSLRSLDMSKTKSEGYCLVLYNKEISIIRTAKQWIITVMFNGCIEYVYQFIFDTYDTILLNNGTTFMGIEEFISSIIETLHK